MTSPTGWNEGKRLDCTPTFSERCPRDRYLSYLFAGNGRESAYFEA